MAIHVSAAEPVAASELQTLAESKSMPEQCYLAVDLGAESGRVIAGLFDGAKVRLEEVHRFPNGPVPVAGSLRWDVLGLWREVLSGLGQAGVKHGSELVSVGVDTWGVDYVLLGEKGEILGQPYNYRDPRTTGLLEWSFTRVPRAEIYATTGLQFLSINTLYQLIAMRQQQPRLLDLADRLLMMPDFFHWLLCGSQVVEFTNATTSQCWDPTRHAWAIDLLRKFEIPVRMFPEVVPPGSSLGPLRKEVAERCRLPRLRVTAPATHDTGSAVAAIPTERTGTAEWAYISSGTWSLMGLELPHPVLTPAAARYNVTNEGGVDGTYRVLKNIMGLWLVQESRRAFERAGQSLSYDNVTQLASEAPAFRSLIDPDAPEFLGPPDMPSAIRNWCVQHGEKVPEDAGQIFRCAFESLALKYRAVLEELESLSGVRAQVIHIVGGGSQNALLNQFAANACGRPVIAGPVEATALGNVLVQARAAGAIGSLSEIRQVVSASSTLQRFEPQSSSAWEGAFERFERLRTGTPR